MGDYFQKRDNTRDYCSSYYFKYTVISSNKWYEKLNENMNNSY